MHARVPLWCSEISTSSGITWTLHSPRLLLREHVPCKTDSLFPSPVPSRSRWPAMLARRWPNNQICACLLWPLRNHVVSTADGAGGPLRAHFWNESPAPRFFLRGEEIWISWISWILRDPTPFSLLSFALDRTVKFEIWREIRRHQFRL